jgi:preprotein translocase subunit SecY
MAFKWFSYIASAVLAGLAAWAIYTGVADALQVIRAEKQNYQLLVDPALSVVLGLVICGMMYYGLWAPTSPIKRVMENIFSIPELIKKLGFTLGLLCIYRVGYYIPLPGINTIELGKMMSGGAGGLSDLLDMAGMFTGGNLAHCTLFGLGIMPYISASIVFQLLTTVVPALEKLRKEGPAGYKKIQEYTRYATVLLCVVQAVFWMNYMNSQKVLYGGEGFGYSLTSVYVMGILGMTAGTMFMMWLGEQIDQYGIGNGISLLIMAGIVARLPTAIIDVGRHLKFQLGGQILGGNPGELGFIELIFLIAAFVFVVAGAILITQGQRRIPIQQAKQMRGRRVVGGQRQYLPLRVNHGGVMPIIFASSLMVFPGLILGWLEKAWPMPNSSEPMSAWSSFWHSALNLVHDAFNRGGWTYEVFYVAMIYFFAYFWTTVQFRPKEMAEQLQDYGSFIPGLRPGRRTADYLERVMERITYCGAGFLSVIAVIPAVVSGWLHINWQVTQFLGGTGLLIVISVALDLVQRIEANLVMRNYGGFLGTGGRIKGAYS